MFNIISSSVEQQDWADGLWYRVPLNLCTCFRSVCHILIDSLKKSLASYDHTWCKRGLKPSISFHFLWMNVHDERNVVDDKELWSLFTTKCADICTAVLAVLIYKSTYFV